MPVLGGGPQIPLSPELDNTSDTYRETHVSTGDRFFPPLATKYVRSTTFQSLKHLIFLHQSVFTLSSVKLGTVLTLSSVVLSLSSVVLSARFCFGKQQQQLQNHSGLAEMSGRTARGRGTRGRGTPSRESTAKGRSGASVATVGREVIGGERKMRCSSGSVTSAVSGGRVGGGTGRGGGGVRDGGGAGREVIGGGEEHVARRFVSSLL